MTQDMVIHEQRPYELTEKQLNIIANTEFVPKEKRGKMDVILASIFRGRALGIDDFTAINEIHIVNGKPGESASLAAALVRRRGHFIDGKVSPDGAIAHGRRADNGAEMTVEFGPKQAQDAGLQTNANYKKYPQSMYWARAVTQLCRSLFSDCFLGGVYTPEELGADFVVDDDIIEHDPPSTLEATVANLQSSGGLTEPGVSKADNGGHTPSVAPPAGVAAPGSVSSLDMLIATYGRDTVVSVYKELFQGRGGEPLTDQEEEWLANELAVRTEA